MFGKAMQAEGQPLALTHAGDFKVDPVGRDVKELNAGPSGIGWGVHGYGAALWSFLILNIFFRL